MDRDIITGADDMTDSEMIESVISNVEVRDDALTPAESDQCRRLVREHRLLMCCDFNGSVVFVKYPRLTRVSA